MMPFTRPAAASPPAHPRVTVVAVLAMVAMLAALAAGCSSDSSDSGAQPSDVDAGLDFAMVPIGGGDQVALSTTRGTPTVVNLWAPWCIPCRTEMPAFEQVHQALGTQVTIIGVTEDTNDDAATKVANDTAVTYPLYRTVATDVQSGLDVTGLPATIFLDADGNVVDRHQGALTADALSGIIKDSYGIS
jgi:thiol-disulfide isomerase/thioredoxin